MPGKVEIIETGNDATITLDANSGNIIAGGNGEKGELILTDENGVEIIKLNITKNSKGASTAGIWAHGPLEFKDDNFVVMRASSGKLVLLDPINGKPTLDLTSAIHPTITIGGNGRNAILKVLNKEDKVGVEINGGIISASALQAANGSGRASVTGDKVSISTDQNKTSISAGQLILSVKGETAANLAGGILILKKSEVGGGTVIVETKVDQKVHIGGEDAQIFLGNTQKSSMLGPDHLTFKNGEDVVIELKGNGVIRSGGSDVSGELSLEDKDGKERIRLTAGLQSIFFRNSNDKIVFKVDDKCDLLLGGSGEDGDISLMSKSGAPRLQLGAEEGRILLKNEDGDFIFNADSSGNLTLQGSPDNSAFVLKRSDGKIAATLASNGELRLGGGGSEGDVILRTSDDKKTARLSSKGDVFLGGNGVSGSVRLYPSQAEHGSSENWSVHIDGEEGDIFLKNADCAEEFETIPTENIEPGNVVVIGDDDRLRLCSKAYDKCVAGVISGAGDYKPGIILDKKVASKGRKPVALMGKVYCKADADYASISVGDLLTTSPTLGYAMKASDPKRAFGAVIGKALQPLKSGRGLIPILIALQ